PAVAALLHMRPHRLGAIERAHDVNVEHEAEIRQIEFRESAVPENAGVVDQYVHPTQRCSAHATIASTAWMSCTFAVLSSASPPSPVISSQICLALGASRSLTRTR